MTDKELRLRWSGTVPVLETERLHMRGPVADDFAVYAETWADPDVIRYITGNPLKEEDAWYGFLRLAGHWMMFGYGYWMVVEKATDEVVGAVGFVDFKRDMTPSLKGEPEIGWVLNRSGHGKGYATEAAQAAIKWGDEHFGGARMSCIIDPGNSPSIRVAEKCGFAPPIRAMYRDEEVLVFHRG